MKTEKEKIRHLIERTFKKGAWHAPAIKDAIAGRIKEQSKQRFQNSHNITGRITHTAAWQTLVTKQITVNDMYEAPDAYPEERFSELVPHPGVKLTFYTVLHRDIHQDLYHADQIKLIAKSLR